jgi:hypothetical protein
LNRQPSSGGLCDVVLLGLAIQLVLARYPGALQAAKVQDLHYSEEAA